MENDIVIDFMLPLVLLGGFFVGGILAIDGFFRLKAKLTGERYESPIVW